MGQRCLGIYIARDVLKAVLVGTKLKGVEVLETFFIPCLEGLGAAIGELSKGLRERPDTVFVTLGSHWVSYRALRLPFKDAKAVSKALPYELESSIPFSLEGKIVDFSPSWDGKESHVLCAIISKEEVQRLLDYLRESGLEPEAIDVDMGSLGQQLRSSVKISDYLFGVLNQEEITIGLVEKSEIKIIRNSKVPLNEMESKEGCHYKFFEKELNMTLSYYRYTYSPNYEPEKIFVLEDSGSIFENYEVFNDSFAFKIDRIDYNIFSNLLGVHKSSNWNIIIPLSAALFSVREKPRFDFMKSLSKGGNLLPSIFKSMKHVIILLFIALILFGFSQLLSLYTLEKRYYSLDRKLRALYSENFGNLPSGSDPLRLAKEKVFDLRKRFKDVEFKGSNAPFIEVLTDVVSRIPETGSVEFNRLVLDAETVQIAGIADSYNTVDILRNELQGSNFVQEVNIQSAKVDKSGKTVNFDLRIKRKS